MKYPKEGEGGVDEGSGRGPFLLVALPATKYKGREEEEEEERKEKKNPSGSLNTKPPTLLLLLLQSLQIQFSVSLNSFF